jgi:hypothetical protein
MNYAKHIKAQQRKQLKAQQKLAKQRAGSSYGGSSSSSTMKTLMGITLLIGYLANSTAVNAYVAGLL